jgi:hypothetical protein
VRGGKFLPAEAGEFSHGTFQPFAKGATGDRCAEGKDEGKDESKDEGYWHYYL